MLATRKNILLFMMQPDRRYKCNVHGNERNSREMWDGQIEMYSTLVYALKREIDNVDSRKNKRKCDNLTINDPVKSIVRIWFLIRDTGSDNYAHTWQRSKFKLALQQKMKWRSKYTRTFCHTTLTDKRCTTDGGRRIFPSLTIRWFLSVVRCTNHIIFLI